MRLYFSLDCLIDEIRILITALSFDGASQVGRDKKSTCKCRMIKFNPWVGKIAWRRK